MFIQLHHTFSGARIADFKFIQTIQSINATAIVSQNINQELYFDKGLILHVSPKIKYNFYGTHDHL